MPVLITGIICNTYQPHTDHIPTTCEPHTNHIPTTYWLHTDHILTTYRKQTNHIPTTHCSHTNHTLLTYCTNHKPTTCWPHTDHIPTTYFWLPPWQAAEAFHGCRPPANQREHQGTPAPPQHRLPKVGRGQSGTESAAGQRKLQPGCHEPVRLALILLYVLSTWIQRGWGGYFWATWSIPLIFIMNVPIPEDEMLTKPWHFRLL